MRTLIYVRFQTGYWELSEFLDINNIHDPKLRAMSKLFFSSKSKYIPDLHYWVKGNSKLSNLHGTMDPDNNSSFIGFEEVTDGNIINRYKELEKKAGIVPQYEDFESLINTYEI